jgi:orotate phosphoribosyltransferase
MRASELVRARRGHYAFPSGFHGDLWLDLDLLFAVPADIAPLAAELARQLPPADAVCGPMTGGALLAELVAVEMRAELAWSELPSYAVPRALGERLRGRRVAVVDDAINAGSAVGATIEALRGCGAEVVGVGTLMLLGGGWSPGVPFVWLEAVESQLWPAADCPLCGDGVPFVSAH